MQKVTIYTSNEQSTAALPAWDSSIVMVGRIPSMGEFIRVSPDSPALEVVRVIHSVNNETGTVAGISLKI